ncbi:MAG: LD-carboxypeptidase [Deltaproteobacteria bacterium]|nr:LD-carboxypeptidase [Deltaproteobacteria bacterium]
MRKPAPLEKGSPVRVIEPSSPFQRDRLPAGLKVLMDMELAPVHSERIFDADGYLAGPDALRAKELVSAFTTFGEKAVIPARGGYGAMRILDEVSGHAGGLDTRLFMGFSDITSLHLFFLGAGDLVTFLGPNVISLSRVNAPTLNRVKATLFGLAPEDTFLYAGLSPLTSGRVQGRLVAGNLSLITSLLGTRFAAELEGAILVLEDVDEPLYRVDRMLTQLVLQDGFHQVGGFAFGDMGVPAEDLPALTQVLRRFSEASGKPAVMGFPIGHGEDNVPVPEGIQALLDADIGLVRALESPYTEK